MRRLIATLAVLALLAGMASAAGLTAVFDKVANVAPTLQIAQARVTFDSSYPTGGESLTASMVGLNEIDILMAWPDTVTAAGYTFGYDKYNDKLFVLGFEDSLSGAAQTLSLEEIDNGTDLSAVIVRVIAFDFTN